MNNVMTFEDGYKAVIAYDPEIEMFRGEFVGDVYKRQRMVRPQSAVGESAESKAIDKTQLDTQLASFARRSGSAEALCWKLAARWLGAKEDGIEAKYNESYDVGEATVKIKSKEPGKKGQG